MSKSVRYLDRGPRGCKIQFMKEKIQFINYAKAISIILVVITHLGYNVPPFFQLFFMPVFFVCSGYVFQLNDQNFGSYVKKKAKRLLFPFWLAMLIYTVVDLFRARYYGFAPAPTVIKYGLTETIYGSGMFPVIGKLGNALAKINPWPELTTPPVDIILPSNCHLWFLPAMFSACCIYYPFAKYKENIKGAWKFLLILLILAIGGIETIPGFGQLPYGFGRGCVGAVCILFGNWIREKKILEQENKIRLLLYFSVGLAVSIVTICFGATSASMVISYYGPYPFVSVLLTAIGGCASSLVFLILCRFIEQIPFNRLKELLSAIGNNSMTIYLWQFLIIGIADFIFLSLTGIDVEPASFYMVVVSPRYFWYKLPLLFLIIWSLTCYGIWKEN